MSAFWLAFRTVESFWLTSILWLIWQARRALTDAALVPIRRSKAALWRRLSLDIDDLE